MASHSRSAHTYDAGGRGRSRGRGSRPKTLSWPSADAWVACLFVVICFLFGGNSKFQLLADVVLRLVSILAIGYALVRMTPGDRRRARPFAWAILAFGALMVAQLIPLPPALWNAMPGHGFYRDALTTVGLADEWRPWSMSPDLTLNSLFALFPLLAAALLFAVLNDDGRRWVLDTLLACLAIAALLGMLQLVSGSYYVYPHNNEGTGVGFFANRNHQALFLAIGMILIFGRWQLAEHRSALPRVAAMLGAVLLLFPVLIVTGSRAGLVAGLIAFAAGGAVFARSLIAGQIGWKRLAIPVAGLTVAGLALAVGAMSSRQVVVQRLFETRSTIGTTELRTANLPALVETTKTFFPLGAGFGTFDAVFRRFESNTLLRPTYFNHAHSEPIEILIEGGLPAALLMIGLLVWLARRSSILVSSRRRSSIVVLSQVGVLGLILLMLGSLVDYPMRTPFLGVLAVLFLTWASGERDETGIA